MTWTSEQDDDRVNHKAVLKGFTLYIIEYPTERMYGWEITSNREGDVIDSGTEHGIALAVARALVIQKAKSFWAQGLRGFAGTHRGRTCTAFKRVRSVALGKTVKRCARFR